MLRPAPVVNVLPLLEEERGELVSLLRGLADGEADTPTACGPWTVRDVATHLLQDDISLLSRRRDGYDDPTRGGPPGGFDEMVSWLNERNQDWVEASSFFSLGTTADLLEATGSITHAYLSGLEPRQPGETVLWAGGGPHEQWLSTAREFSERWIHQQHIRDALDAPGLNGPQFVSPLLQTLMRAVVPAYAEVEADTGTTVALVIEGRAGGNWAIRRDEDGWALYEGRDKEAAAVVSTDQTTAWRYLARVIERSEAQPAITISGGEALGAPFLDAVAAMVPRRRSRSAVQ